jgi:hypothetical protein
MDCEQRVDWVDRREVGLRKNLVLADLKLGVIKPQA